MRLAGDGPADIGAMLGLSVSAVVERIKAIVASLAQPGPAALIPAGSAA
jgi:hypothetical protein